MELQEYVGNEQLPSVLNNPFCKNSIKRISVSFAEYSSGWTAYGTVEFQNGNTKGEQKLTGQTFDDVVLQIKALIEEFNEQD